MSTIVSQNEFFIVFFLFSIGFYRLFYDGVKNLVKIVAVLSL